MVNYTIRPLETADSPFLWDMLYYALYVPEGAEPFPREVVQQPALSRYVVGWGWPGDFGFLAVDEAAKRPIGAVWARLWTAENHGFGYVDDETPELSIALLPAYRGQGIGGQLLERLLAEAGKQFSAVSLSVSPDNPARRLYERLGFEIIGVNGTSFTMIKQLTPF